MSSCVTCLVADKISSFIHSFTSFNIIHALETVMHACIDEYNYMNDHFELIMYNDLVVVTIAHSPIELH